MTVLSSSIHQSVYTTAAAYPARIQVNIFVPTDFGHAVLSAATSKATNMKAKAIDTPG